MAVISLAALTRHQNQRRMNSSPVPAPIWSKIWKAWRAFSNSRVTMLVATIRPTVASRPTSTSRFSLASGRKNRLYKSLTR